MSDLPQVIRPLLQRKSDVFVSIAIIIAVIMFIVPLPTVLLDMFQSLNLVFALMIIMITLYTHSALEFTIFPTILLFSTVFSLALNISSTRLILNLGSQFDGKMIRAFSTFVVGSNGTLGIVVGTIIFVIIIIVQYLVITKGATRVAEVAARFTLDALPGKQMAIDQEYSSGLISEKEAHKRKDELQKEVDFYGAMDGSSKFISGNVIAGIIITLINIIGGIIIGVTIHGENFSIALTTYVSLTIGDGLVTQLPALLVSTATGIMVTRAVSDGTFGGDVQKQFAKQTMVYWMLGGVLLFLSFLPGFPLYILLPMAFFMFFLGYTFSKSEQEQLAKEKFEREAAMHAPKTNSENITIMPLEPLSLELGYGLVPLVDQSQGAELLERITKIRRELAVDFGFIVPRIRIVDNVKLDASGYCVKLRGIEIGRGILRLGQYLCINPRGIDLSDIKGERTHDPTFGLPALWISEVYREQAERVGLTVVDAPSIIATHLTELIKRNAADILDRKEVKNMIDELKKEYSVLVDEVLEHLSVGQVQKIFQNLLNEQVSIRNIVIIMENIADYAKLSTDVAFLTEKVRQALGRQLCLQYANQDKVLYVISVKPELEQQLIEHRVETPQGPIAALPPEVHMQWIAQLMQTVRMVQNQGFVAVILCQEQTRMALKNSCKKDIPDLVVLSVPEIVRDIQVEGIAEIALS